jgi:hypothetical protein
MRTNKAFWISLVVTMAVAPLALAKSTADVQPVSPLPKASMLADNVVVAPGGGSPAQTAPAQPVQTQPVQPVYTEPAPAPTRHTVVHEHEDHNYVATVALSALMGGVAGALIGGAIYYLDNQNHPYNIAYWAAGGVLVGTGIGVVQIAVQESRASAAVSQTAPTDPAPTYRLALYTARF